MILIAALMCASFSPEDARIENEFIETVHLARREMTHSPSSPGHARLANYIYKEGVRGVPAWLHIAERCRRTASQEEVSLCEIALKAAAQYADAEDEARVKDIAFATPYGELRRQAVSALFSKHIVGRLELLRAATAHATEDGERAEYVGDLLVLGDPLGAPLVDELLAPVAESGTQELRQLAKRVLLSTKDCLPYKAEARGDAMTCRWICKGRRRTHPIETVAGTECPAAPLVTH